MPVITVSQLNNYMRRYVDNNRNLSDLYVKGEISNFKRHSSGHIYMTLKDEGSVLKCVMFMSCASKLKFNPESGMKVIAFGKVSVYERDGAYQLYVERLVPDGKGELYAAFEQLKFDLENAGYFDASQKKALPKYPKKIGIVTSPEGAAIRDITSVLGRRYPAAGIVLYPALVQGVGAAKTVAAGIDFFSNSMCVDVIIIGRGGGSIEDLWAFNERIVADAIHYCKIPVISAVGHETDFTIADFVADMRAPTPSAAAEIAVPDEAELISDLKMYDGKLKHALLSCVRLKRQQLDAVLKSNMEKTVLKGIMDKRITTDDSMNKCISAFDDILNTKITAFEKYCAKLDALSPIKVLSRGYSVARNNGKVVQSISNVSKGDKVEITVCDGYVYCTADNTVKK